LPGRIIKLPEDVANQIAAGEVVERPASVVKELVENAVDAGAKRVSIEIEEGGQRSIRVTDDGSGMSREDAVLSLERHATSKIRTLDDLETVGTFGFRGEAIPSIASVSRFSMITRQAIDDEGTRIVVEGRGIEVAACGAAPGTVIEVRDLFFNVPARKKFQKRASTEMSHMTDAVERLALANRKVAFKLSSEGRALLDVPSEAEGDPKGRLARILGKQISDHLYPIEPHRGVTGFVSAPELSERTARGIYTFVNQRFVRDRTIQHAITDAYRTLLERGRYPVVVLFLEVDPRSFDVNVHPQKIEVRFERTGDIHRAVSGAIAQSLAGQPWLVPASNGPARRYVLKSEPARPDMVREPSSGRQLERFFDLIRPIATPRQLEAELGGKFSSLVPVGQVLATYLVCQGPDRMVVIDQHAAHERIAFEIMRKQRRSRALEVQPLLVPLTIELDPARAQIAADERERLLTIGLELEPFGGGTWLVKSAPTALGQAKLERMVLDVLDELKEIGESTSFEESIDALLSCTACHTVVRAGDRMRTDEIAELLRQMDEIDFGAHCPHGRPVFVEWSADELARLFHRS
jgi:DNA mismatch repair protein MutL